MDEPFSALDPLIRTKLQDELLLLQDALKKTIIFVSHDLEEALKIGSTITIMDGGRIVQSGSPENIVIEPANNYVRDFIANVNPLSVLTAWNVMRLKPELEACDGDSVWLDRRRTTRCKLDEAGRVVSTERDGQSVRLVSIKDIDTVPEGAGAAFWATVDTSLKAVMFAMHRSHSGPVALLEGDGRLVGSIGIHDAMSAILRR